MTSDGRSAERTEVPAPDTPQRGNVFALEILFLGFIGLVTMVAFFEALTYELVSSRTPLVIMAPLFVLIVVHARRLWRVRHDFRPGFRIRMALGGGNPHFNKVLGFSGWLVALVAIIAVLGHYVGVFVFCLILMRYHGRESWGLTLAVAAGATVFIYGTFEYLFNIDLYRGLVLRWFLGYRDF